MEIMDRNYKELAVYNSPLAIDRTNARTAETSILMVAIFADPLHNKNTPAEVLKCKAFKCPPMVGEGEIEAYH